MEFDSNSALQIARRISIPRVVGTPEEKAVAGYLAEQLRRYGFKVSHQGFKFSNALETAIFVELMIGTILVLLTLGYWIYTGQAPSLFAALIIGLVLLVSPFNRAVQNGSVTLTSERPDRRWSRFCARLGGRFYARNIVATHATTEDDPRPHLMLVSHYDSKSQRISLVKRIALFALFISAGLVYAALLLLGNLLPELLPAAVLVAFSVLVAGLVLMSLRVGNLSPGAIDNAAGVGVCLQLAKSYHQDQDFQNKIAISILITSAEEFGLMGARAYLREYKDALQQRQSRQPQYILNFEGNGLTGKVFMVTDSNTGTFPESAPTLSDYIRKAAAQVGMEVRRLVIPGALMDHMPFSEAGFDALSLITIGSGTRAIHTEEDTPDKLSVEGFEQVGDLAIKLIQLLSSSTTTSPADGSATN